MTTNSAHLDAGDEQLILDAIDKWLEQKVKPVAMELEHDETKYDFANSKDISLLLHG